MYTQGQEYAKIGRVTVDIKRKSYRIRFTYPKGKRHEFGIAKVSPEGWTTAIKAAQLINRDIELGDFDVPMPDKLVSKMNYTNNCLKSLLSTVGV